jgi:DNA-binding NarL/FixJ family response regulator
VVVMDIMLPDGTGLEATLSILAERPATKIVFLTVHDDDDNLFAAIRAGGVGFLSKDIGIAELVSKLRGVMRGEAAITPTIARHILEEFSRLPPAPAIQPETVELTDREIEIVRALARGASNREIAERLVITENTVKNHVQNVLLKLHLHSRRDVVDYARRHGLMLSSGNFPK